MNHNEIKKALRDAGLSFTSLAAATGRNPQNFSAVSKRDVKSRPTAMIIAAALEKPIEDVFPDIPQYAEPSREQKAKESVDKAKQLIKAAGLSELVA